MSNSPHVNLLRSIGVEVSEENSERVLHADPGPDYLGNARRMKTEVWVDTESGTVFGKTRTWTKEAARGFTGKVVLVFVDEHDMPFARTDPQSFGVDGEYMLWGTSDRTTTWQDELSPDETGKVKRVDIIHTAAPSRIVKRLEETCDELIEAGEVIDVTMEKLSQLEIVQTLVSLIKGGQG